MRIRFVSTLALVLLLGTVSYAQDAPPPPATQSAPGNGSGQRERGGWGGGMMGMGRGLTGTVTVVAADHYTIKTDAGDSYTVHFSANTRILKQGAGGRDRDQGAQQSLKPADIKVGDAIAAMGEVDATAKSVGAMMILQVDPERAKQMREMQANYGKTWIMGKVTAINEVKVTLLGSVDNTAHVFVADENTTFRKRREPITLADIQVGDMVRAEGAVKDGIFVATTVSVMGMPPNGGGPGGMPSVPRDGPPPPQQQ